MPIYLDRHEDLGGISAVDQAAAHLRDLAVQDTYGVKYLTYWFDHEKQKSWCLVDTDKPDRSARSANPVQQIWAGAGQARV